MDSLKNLNTSQLDLYTRLLGFAPTDINYIAARPNIKNFYQLERWLDKNKRFVIIPASGLPDLANEFTARCHGLDPIDLSNGISYNNVISIQDNVGDSNPANHFNLSHNTVYIGAEFLIRYMYDFDMRRIDGISLYFGWNNNRVWLYMTRVWNNFGVVNSFKRIISGDGGGVYRLTNRFNPIVRTESTLNTVTRSFKDNHGTNDAGIDNGYQFNSYTFGRDQLMDIIEKHRTETGSDLKKLGIRIKICVDRFPDPFTGHTVNKIKLLVNGYRNDGTNHENAGKVNFYLTAPFNIVPPSGASCVLPCPAQCPE